MSSANKRDIRIRGGQHHRYQEALREGWLKLGVELHLQRDPSNAYDSNAIMAGLMKPKDVGAVSEPEFVCIGFVAADQAKQLYWRFDRGAVVLRCTVRSITEKKNSLDAYLEIQGGWHEKQPLAGAKPEKQVFDDLEDDIPF